MLVHVHVWAILSFLCVYKHLGLQSWTLFLTQVGKALALEEPVFPPVFQRTVQNQASFFLRFGENFSAKP